MKAYIVEYEEEVAHGLREEKRAFFDEAEAEEFIDDCRMDDNIFNVVLHTCKVKKSIYKVPPRFGPKDEVKEITVKPYVPNTDSYTYKWETLKNDWVPTVQTGGTYSPESKK